MTPDTQADLALGLVCLTAAAFMLAVAIDSGSRGLYVLTIFLTLAAIAAVLPIGRGRRA